MRVERVRRFLDGQHVSAERLAAQVNDYALLHGI
jgi:hypothetical protein